MDEKSKGVLNQIKAMAPGQTLLDKGDRASVQGLQIRAHASKISFLLYYRTKEGVQRRPRIGDFGPITLAQARAIAKDILDRVARGEDPQGDWRKARGEMTVKDLFQKFHREYWDCPRYRKSGWEREVLNLFKANIEKRFGSTRISAVSRADVKEWLSQYESVPYTGNRSLEVLNKLYNLAEEDGIVPRGTNPCWKIKAFPERKRERFAAPEELSRLLSILERDATDSPEAVAFIYLILFTGSRPSGLERAMRKDLRREIYEGQERGVLSFEGKGSAESGQSEKVIVPPIALEMLDRLPLRKDGLLLGIKNPRRYWLSVRKELGSPDLWVRDLRRTFATVGMSGGVTKDVIGKLLNHTSTQTTDIYAKLDMSARFEASDRIAARIREVSNVVPMRRV